MAKEIDITGLRAGMLVARRAVGKNKNGCVLWECDCDCGGTRIAMVSVIRRMRVVSCGCAAVGYGAEVRRAHGILDKKSQKPPAEISLAESLRKLHRFNRGHGIKCAHDPNDFSHIVVQNAKLDYTPEDKGLVEAKIYSGSRLK